MHMIEISEDVYARSRYYSQGQVITIYIPQILWDVIIACLHPWYLLLEHKSSNIMNFGKRVFQNN